MTFMVDDLQSTDPEFLAPMEGITVSLSPEKDSMGFDRATVEGPTREAVIAYVRREWGDEDPEWFQEWVVDRVVEVERSGDIQVTIPADTIPYVVGYILDGLSEEYAAQIEGTEMGGGWSPVEYAVVPALLPFMADGDRALAQEILDKHDKQAGKGGNMKRVVLVHLNVEVPESDTRTAEEIGGAIYGALEVGSDNDAVRDLDIAVALTDEIE